MNFVSIETRAIKASQLKIAEGPGSWSYEEQIELVKLWNEDGLSASKIGKLMGKSRNSIIGKVHRMKLNPRIATECSAHAKKAKARKLRKVNIAAEFLPKQAVPEFIPEPMDWSRNKAWEPLPGTTPAKLTELAATACRWPVLIGLFCGCATTRGSWCDTHRSIGIRKVEA